MQTVFQDDQMEDCSMTPFHKKSRNVYSGSLKHICLVKQSLLAQMWSQLSVRGTSLAVAQVKTKRWTVLSPW